MIRQDLKPNSLDFEQLPFVKATGFREYDARWLFEKEINLIGIQRVGMALGTMVRAKAARPEIVVGHDYRSYSASIKMALITGLMAAGVKVHDIGMCTTPMAYFAQFHLDVPAVAMVTASHNDNGWTGIKMGMEKPLTFGPEEMSELKTRVLEESFELAAGGALVLSPNIYPAYLADLVKAGSLKRKLRVACVCGNGTAGAFAPQVLKALGCEVIEIDCDLDHSFPKYNPNPEDLEMLHVMQKAVKDHKLDLAFGFDGDGDRCGVVDNQGRMIFADKIGLMLTRDLAALHKNATFVVDVKSTGLYATDPVLKSLGATVDYYKTGHSYIKRRTTALNAVAGFEKSGHYFFRPPHGHGYDDGLVSAVAICRMLERAAGKSLADLYEALPLSFSSPTMSPHCDDDKKYHVVEKLIADVKALVGQDVAGSKLIDINTVNGVRFTMADGSWGLIRASSNKPELVTVCESMTSDQQLRDVFKAIQKLLAKYPEVGAFNQTI